mgnify:CR=1 FL=1|jgi:hypothetical protein
MDIQVMGSEQSVKVTLHIYVLNNVTCVLRASVPDGFDGIAAEGSEEVLLVEVGQVETRDLF